MESEESIMIATPSKEETKPKFPYMEKIIRMSTTVNMWPNTRKVDPFRYHLVVWFIIAVCVLHILSIGIKIKADYRHLDSVAFLVDALTGVCSATFRFIYVYVKGDEYLLLVSLIHNNFMHCSLFPKENRASLQKYYKLANNLSLVYGGFTLFWMFKLFAAPFFTYVWKLSVSENDTQPEIIPYSIAMRVYAPFDYDKQPGNALFFAYQFVYFMMIIWIYVLGDCFWYMVIFLTIGQFVLLKDSVDTVSEIVRKTDSTDGLELLTENESKQVEEGLKHCIRHHQFTREFVRLLNEVNGPNMLVLSLHAVISMGFVLLEMTIALNVGDQNRVQHSIEYFMAVMIHIFFYSWLGDELTEKEEELAEAAYDFPWYKCPNQKPLIMLMSIQARRPSRVTGGKIYKLSLEFFTSVMQASFSYFTFFLEFRNTE